MANSGEVRVVDPKTGGEKGQKLERFDLIPNEFERALAAHYGKGAQKYEDRNWERGYRWSLSVGALRRHLAAWLDGESIDAETGSNHLIAVAWHAIALFIFEIRGLGTDDVRSKERSGGTVCESGTGPTPKRRYRRNPRVPSTETELPLNATTEE